MKHAPTSRRAALLGDIVVFLAGFTFLVYEVSWNRVLALVLGATVAAATMVLASFMAGFGAGAWVWGRLSIRSSRPGTILAALLAGVGLLGALDYRLFTSSLPGLYASLGARNAGTIAMETLVFAAAGILLFAPAFLMGGVFPLVSRIVIGRGGPVASGLGRLYSLETLGSTLGGLAAGFVMLGTLGQRDTVLVAVAVNVLLAALLGGAFRFGADEPGRDERSADGESGRGTKPSPRGPARTTRRIALAGAFACGFAILALQVLWIRVFRVYFTNTSYTFALVSSLVIAGLFAGSFAFQRRGEKIRDHARALLAALVLLAGTAALGLALLVYLPQTLMFPFESSLQNPIARTFLLPFVASLLVVVPPAVFSGYAFPLACRMVTGGGRRVGGDVGLVLMVNTAGAVLGPFVAAFLLLPVLGAVRAGLVVLLIPAATAVEILRRERPRRAGLLMGVAAAAALSLAVALLAPVIRVLPPSFVRFDRQILFYRESVEGTLSVGQDRAGTMRSKYTYVDNSAVIGSTYDAVKVVKMVGHTPFFLGLRCRNALVIGFGIGVTTSAIASHSEVESIDCVELVDGLADASVYYRDLNRGVAGDPRLTLISGDGRHYLQRTSKKYDLVSCDPTHPILGSSNLYTKEYFELCKAHLAPGGMVSQYLPLHKLRTADFIGLIRTFHAVFPNATVWLGHYHAVLIGSLAPIEVDFNEWAANVARIGEDEYFYADPYHLAATMMLDGDAIDGLPAGSGINTDDRSYTEFFAPSCLDAANLAGNLRFFLEHRTYAGRVFRRIPDEARMERFAAGNRLLTESLAFMMNAENEKSLEALRRASTVNPEDREFPFLIQLYY